MRESNFSFLENINPERYNELLQEEKSARTDFKKCGNNMRITMENIINDVICDKIPNGKKIRNDKSLSLDDKITLLQDEQELRRIGYLKNGEFLKNKRILPNLGEISFKCKDGEKRSCDYYAFMRRFGNACSHADELASNPVVSYENVVKCMRGFFAFYQKYYHSRTPKEMPGFDEHKMPIGEYYVSKSYIPNDRIRSKCQREYLAYKVDEDDEAESYAVLRLYYKKDISETFLKRNYKCFVVASKTSINSVPEGMVYITEITPIHSTSSDFYIISYNFNREPRELSDDILKDMSVKQRIKLCYGIAKCMRTLHGGESPISHRLLNYESIFLCEYKGEWSPYIIKLDFAKIDSKIVKQTVLKNTINARNKLSEKKLVKYLPPEWASIDENQKVNWIKVDIYSLGILFTDILSGKIQESTISLDDLEQMGFSEDLLALLDFMCADDPESRFEIQDVCDVLKDELER